MHEHIVPTVERGDETESLCRVEPLNSTNLRREGTSRSQSQRDHSRHTIWRHSHPSHLTSRSWGDIDGPLAGLDRDVTLVVGGNDNIDGLGLVTILLDIIGDLGVNAKGSRGEDGATKDTHNLYTQFVHTIRTLPGYDSTSTSSHPLTFSPSLKSFKPSSTIELRWTKMSSWGSLRIAVREE